MGGDHGHGHGPPYKVPDYKIYKIEDVPELQLVQNALKKDGLHDPWLRNYVWKYDVKNLTKKAVLQRTWYRGMKWGFVAALITTGIGYMLPEEEHGHGHGHGAEGGGHH